VVTPGYVSTPKCLYGLAAGLPLVQPRWITDSVAADRRLVRLHPSVPVIDTNRTSRVWHGATENGRMAAQTFAADG
jgi:hypothetical protein